MQLLAVTLNEFKQFLELLMWVAIPLIVVSITVTLAIHYWRKKRNALSDDYDTDYSESVIMPREIGTDPDQSTYGGMLWLRRKYQDDMVTADQKAENLRARCFELEKKCSALQELQTARSGTDHVRPGIFYDNPAKPYDETELSKLRLELEELRSRLSPLQLELDHAKAEASDLHQQLAESQTATNLVNADIRQVLDPEASLFERTSADLAEERSRQISFLQQQLEDRIRMFHEVESQCGRVSGELHATMTDLSGLRTEISLLQSVNQSKTVYIDELEKDLGTLQQQSSAHISQLNEKLETEMNKSYDLDQKLSFNQRLLQKIQQEISDSFDKQMILYTGRGKSDMQHDRNITPKISAWIESPSEEENEFEQII